MISLLYINLGSQHPRDRDFILQLPRGALGGARGSTVLLCPCSMGGCDLKACSMWGEVEVQPFLVLEPWRQQSGIQLGRPRQPKSESSQAKVLSRSIHPLPTSKQAESLLESVL